MIFPPSIIAALAVPVSGSCKHEGVGRVERQIDAARYVLRMGREKITVCVTEGALAVGQRVSVSECDGKLVIAAAVPHAREISNVGQACDYYLRDGWRPIEGGKPSLDAIIGALTSACGTPQDARRSEALFEALAPRLDAIDPELTRRLRHLFTALAALPPDEPAGAEMVRAAAELLQRLKGAYAETAVPLPGRCFVALKSIPDGIYRFSDFRGALEFFGVTGVSGDGDETSMRAQAMALRPAEDGAVMIRAIACGTGATAVVSLRPDEIPREFEALSRACTSRAFQSIPLGCFEQLLRDRPSVRFDTVRFLDGLAAAQNLPAAAARAGSREAQEAALVQWLHTALERSGATAIPPATLPTFSAASIIGSLEELAAATAHMPLPALRLPSAQQVAITEEAVMETDKARVLGSVFKQLGCDLERTLALSETAEKGSLKVQLLELARCVGSPACAESRFQEEGERPAPVATEKRIVSRINRLERVCLSFVEKAFAIRAEALSSEPAANRPPEHIKPIPEPNQSAALAGRELSTLLRTRLAELSTFIVTMLNKAAAIRALSPPEYVQSSGPVIRSRVEALLVSLKNDIQDLPRRFPLLPQQGAGPDEGGGTREGAMALPPGGGGGRAYEALEACVNGVVRRLDDFRPKFVDYVETVFGDLARMTVRRAFDGESNEPVRHDAAPPQVREVPGEHDTATTAREAVRRIVETLLNRVESLQLLARQVSTAAGDQQIVALPMKIGNEWTEVHVRFVRRRGRKGSAESRMSFTVVIDVAPSQLGAISARFDYHRKKSCTLAMGFEYEDTRWWFASRKSTLCKALLAIGIPSPRIEFRSIPGARSVRTALEGNWTAPSPTIDVKA